MDKYTICYKDKPYPVVQIDIFKDTPEEEEILVGTTELEKELITDITGFNPYDSKEAESFDNSIAFYIEPHEMNLPLPDIVKIVEQNYY